MRITGCSHLPTNIGNICRWQKRRQKFSRRHVKSKHDAVVYLARARRIGMADICRRYLAKCWPTFFDGRPITSSVYVTLAVIGGSSKSVGQHFVRCRRQISTTFLCRRKMSPTLSASVNREYTRVLSSKINTMNCAVYYHQPECSIKIHWQQITVRC